jgi:hypothetical protein
LDPCPDISTAVSLGTLPLDRRWHLVPGSVKTMQAIHFSNIAPESTASFSQDDDFIYGNMSPYRKWQRSKTIGRGEPIAILVVHLRMIDSRELFYG